MSQPGSDVSDWRVPQTFEAATSYEVRDVVQRYVVRDLLGPWDGEHESWSPVTHPGAPRDPRDRYLVGMLGPKKADQVNNEMPEDLGLGATVSHESDLPEAVNPRTLGKLWVSSMGLSFQVAAGPDGPQMVVAEVGGARYANDHSELTDDGKTVRPVSRQPLHWTVEVDLGQPDYAYALEDEIWLRCQVRDHRGRRVVRLTLINDQSAETTPKYRGWLFQTSLVVTALDGTTDIFLPTGDQDLPHADPEEAHLTLLYAHNPSFATGHNIAACVDRHDDADRAWRIRTAWVPVIDLPEVTAAPVEGLETSMARLAELADAADPAGLTAALEPLTQAYQVWIDGRQQVADALHADWRPIGQDAVRAAGKINDRLRLAVDLLRDNLQARQAFAFANRAMRLQRHNSVAAGLRERTPTLSHDQAQAAATDGDESIRNASWRPFQLAFVLLNLPSLTDPDSAERREDVDLLYFPTGGGKTEAYLGLAAYTFAIRRLQGVVGAASGRDARDGRSGVAVLMRYTLRLLTAQQFQRAAALVCAAEVLRRDDPQTWGRERFSIGLWVGMSVSPNWYTDAATSIANARESGRRGQQIPVLQTTRCPWCAEPLRGERDLHVDDVTRQVRLYCPRGEPGPSGSRADGGG